MDIVILHGTLGSPEGNWFPWLKQQLEAQGHTVYVPSLPTPDGQTKENWCAALREQAPLLGAETVLVGHSCGATFVLHVLETLKHPVAAAVLVSPVTAAIGNEEYDTLNDSFIHHAFTWPDIRRNAGALHLLHGTDDPYVPTEQPLELAQNLGISVEWIEKGGHLNAEFGYTSFNRILEIITTYA